LKHDVLWDLNGNIPIMAKFKTEFDGIWMGFDHDLWLFQHFFLSEFTVKDLDVWLKDERWLMVGWLFFQGLYYTLVHWRLSSSVNWEWSSLPASISWNDAGFEHCSRPSGLEKIGRVDMPIYSWMGDQPTYVPIVWGNDTTKNRQAINNGNWSLRNTLISPRYVVGSNQTWPWFLRGSSRPFFSTEDPRNALWKQKFFAVRNHEWNWFQCIKSQFFFPFFGTLSNLGRSNGYNENQGVPMKKALFFGAQSLKNCPSLLLLSPWYGWLISPNPP
jgi:hypothetical protein